ncbi:MAG: hypothetical protein EOO52_12880 [Gammaproteobacteria bacterium]|nr:MAG: hypothetical protein EOO52_12880 [Gammaproteobacteria bacterium]
MKEVKYLNPYAAAQLVSKEKALRNLSPTLPILLLGCNTGTGSAPYAMEVSKYLSEDIYGVNGWLVVDQLGTSRTGQGGLISSYLNYGNFQTRRFRQGREIFD